MFLLVTVGCSSKDNAPPTKKTYTVTFDSQDATVAADPTSIKVTSPATTVGTLPTAPTKTGGAFAGWWTGPGGTGTQFTASTEVTANITVYANWSSYSYTVTFDSQQATVAANPASITITAPATNLVTAGISQTPPTRDGYAFAGWWTGPGGAGKVFGIGTTVTANITVYAKWSSYSYTVTFDSQHATVAADPASITITSPATTLRTAGIVPTAPTRAGWKFNGWWTGTGGTGTEFGIDTTITGNITVYAYWISTTKGDITLKQTATAYTQADLAGTWNIHFLRIGNEHKWQIGTARIGSSGNATITSCMDSTGGNSCPAAGTVQFTIAANGVISASGTNASPNTHMTMTSNKNFIVGTADNNSATSFELWIMQKVVSGTSYSNADLQNKSLVSHELTVGNQNHWRYWTGTTDANGMLTISSETDPSGTDTPGATGETLSVDSTGAVTGNGMYGFLSADKKTLVSVGTYTDTNGTSYDLTIIQITGQTYTAGTLPAGTYYAHMLAVGNSPAPFWLHSTTTADSGGIMTFSDWVSSNSAITNPGGSYRGLISASGTVTITEMPTYNGQVSNDGKFIVATQTNATGGYSLQINTN
jgi:uncharacterized repeat protein (TIGR02543 family)